MVRTPKVQPELREELRTRLMGLSYPAFCRLIRKLLVRSGYTSIRSTGTGTRYKTVGQGGLDLLAFAHTDLATTLTAIQVKRTKEPVPSRYVDQLRGTCLRLGAEQGLIIAASAISPLARKAASSVQNLPVQLVDGGALIEMLVERQLGATQVQKVETVWQEDTSFFASLENGAAE